MRGAVWAQALGESLARGPATTVAWMEQRTRLLKSDTYSRVGLLELQGQACLLKLYLAKSPWQRIAFRLGYSRALRSFDMALALAGRGLPVPAPRACVQVQEGMLLLTEGMPDGRDLRRLWLEPAEPGRAELLMHCAGETLAALHLAGFAHGDGKWSNLLWRGEGFFLIDLDAVRPVKADAGALLAIQPRQLRDLARFSVDAEELGATPQQYNIFLQRYCDRMHCSRELLLSELNPAASAIRRRHAKKYGRAPTAGE
jgi:tRNA A-37 threonylcarbamoyl transferase component Bud32